MRERERENTKERHFEVFFCRFELEIESKRGMFEWHWLSQVCFGAAYNINHLFEI